MTNSYDVDHGLSQDAPGPLEPVELAASPVSTVEQGDAHEEIHALRQCAIKYLKWLGVSDPHAGLESDLRNPEMVSKPITMTHPTARDWKAIDAAVREYLDGYEMEGDGGYYVPNNRERAILDDAVAGLLADDDFLAHMGRPAPAAVDARDAHFDLLQDDMVVASASGPRAQALQEIQNYAAVYGQDGPVQIEEVIRIPFNAAQRQGDA
ncbi:hypothetical protein [Achromobacter ruhlandii]|uniref:Uncharacterized protein n=1 Tax=Achromobacter ruhlandii TaxID=72557 RepID=A0A2M9GPE7_9BURK|nr:hypothetical protein [Achromobacter ruhlandii]PJM66437.1 hypothetical protein CV751_30220 [Achromobacter ruhlandii]CAB3920056.1 hypothetical protein LMG3328_05311 [Achromobacter ruhlandii]